MRVRAGLTIFLCVPVLGLSAKAFRERGELVFVGRAVELELPESLGISGPPTSVRRRFDGRLILARGTSGTPVEFGADGRIARSLGAVGDGPGEFRSAEAADWLADSIVVFDRAHRRLTVMGSGARRYLRSAPIPDGFTAARADRNGTLVVNAEVNDRERIGKPFHVFDRTGNHVRSIGDLGGSYVRGLSPPPMYAIGLSNSSFWAVSMVGGGSIRRWSTGGDLLDSIVPAAPWNQVRWDSRRRVSEKAPPPPLVLGAEVEPLGRLWLMILIPSSSWPRAVRTRAAALGEGPARLEIVDRHLAFDTIIEVYDTSSRSLLAAKTFDEAYVGFAGAGFVIHYEEDPLLTPKITLRELSVR